VGWQQLAVVRTSPVPSPRPVPRPLVSASSPASCRPPLPARTPALPSHRSVHTTMPHLPHSDRALHHPPYKQHANTTCKHTQTQKQPGAQHTSTSWRLSCGAKVTASRGQVHGRSQSSSAKISQPVWCTSRMATVVRFPRFAVKSAAPSPVPDTRTRSHPRPRTASQTCVPFHHPPRRPAHAALATCRCCALGHRCYSPLPAAARRRCCCCYDVPS